MPSGITSIRDSRTVGPKSKGVPALRLPRRDLSPTSPPPALRETVRSPSQRSASRPRTISSTVGLNEEVNDAVMMIMRHASPEKRSLTPSMARHPPRRRSKEGGGESFYDEPTAITTKKKLSADKKAHSAVRDSKPSLGEVCFLEPRGASFLRGPRRRAVIVVNLCDFKPEDVILLIDSYPSSCYRHPSFEGRENERPGDTVLWKDRQPTRRNILLALNWLREDTLPGDCLVFYFAGHGVQVDDMSGWEGEGYDEAILPLDFFGDEVNALTAVMIKNLLLSVSNDVQVTMVLDCNGGQTMLDPAGTGGWSFIKGVKQRGVWPIVTDPTNKVARATYDPAAWTDPSMRKRGARPRFVPGVDVSSTQELLDPTLQRPSAQIGSRVKGYLFAAAPWGQSAIEAKMPGVCLYPITKDGRVLSERPCTMFHGKKMPAYHGVFTWAFVSALRNLMVQSVTRTKTKNVLFQALVEEVDAKIRFCRSKEGGLPKLTQNPELTFYKSGGGQRGDIFGCPVEGKKFIFPSVVPNEPVLPCVPHETRYLSPWEAEEQLSRAAALRRLHDPALNHSLVSSHYATPFRGSARRGGTRGSGAPGAPPKEAHARRSSPQHDSLVNEKTYIRTRSTSISSSTMTTPTPIETPFSCRHAVAASKYCATHGTQNVAAHAAVAVASDVAAGRSYAFALERRHFPLRRSALDALAHPHHLSRLVRYPNSTASDSGRPHPNTSLSVVLSEKDSQTTTTSTTATATARARHGRNAAPLDAKAAASTTSSFPALTSAASNFASSPVVGSQQTTSEARKPLITLPERQANALRLFRSSCSLPADSTPAAARASSNAAPPMQQWSFVREARATQVSSAGTQMEHLSADTLMRRGFWPKGVSCSGSPVHQAQGLIEQSVPHGSRATFWLPGFPGRGAPSAWPFLMVRRSFTEQPYVRGVDSAAPWVLPGRLTTLNSTPPAVRKSPCVLLTVGRAEGTTSPRTPWRPPNSKPSLWAIRRS